MNDKQLCAQIEAILFSVGEPVEIKLLASVLNRAEIEIKAAAAELMRVYESEERGIQLLQLEDSYQLATKPQFYDELITITKHPKKPVLTDTVMETLSIIAYRQPVTKNDIEKIRGVSSDFAVNRLVEFGLVKEVGRLNAPGRPILFGTTDEFLRRFGFSAVSDIPQMDPVLEADLKAEAEANIEVTV